MSIRDRLEAIRDWLGGMSQKGASAAFGLGENTWAQYERSGKLPNGEVLLQLAERGVNLHWLATGQGTMLVHAAPDGGGATESVSVETGLSLPQRQMSAASTMDSMLCGRIAQGLELVYREAGMDLPARTLGELVAAWHGELVAKATDPADQLVKLGEKLAEVRRQLRA